MEDKDLEKGLGKLKEGISVNGELKQSLRRRFLIKRRNMWIKRTSIIAAALIIVFIAVLIADNANIKTVKADAFKISNQLSYAEISSGDGIQINEFNGIQYITIHGKGIYRYYDLGYHSIYEGEVSSADLSRDGKSFIISVDGGLILFDIDSKNKTELLKSDNMDIYFEEPSWMDEENILYTKKIIEPVEPHGFAVKEASIYKMNINSLESEKIAEGTRASFAKDRNSVVFERDNRIIYRDLSEGSEIVVDDGRFPDISPDGKYIVYVKCENTTKELAEGASVLRSLSNVWITDIKDFKIRQKITFNFINEYVDEKEWLSSLEEERDKSIPQQLVFSGMYDYYNPVWSSNSKSLFTVKFLSGQDQGSSKIVRIDFGERNLSKIDTVKRYIQALILRDDDYARSLMKNPAELPTISNPRQSGYSIISDGRDETGDYVEAEVYWYYTGTPYYSIERSKFYLSQGEEGYLIGDVKLIERAEAYFKNSSMYLKKGGEERKLFNEDSIPSEFYIKGSSQLQSLVNDTKSGSLIFSVYDNRYSLLSFVKYNINLGEFNRIGSLKGLNNEKVMGTSYIALDSTGKYAAANVYYGMGEDIRNTVIIYNLEENTEINMGNIIEGGFDSLYINFFEDGKLIFSGTKNNEEVKYKYDLKKGTIAVF